MTARPQMSPNARLCELMAELWVACQKLPGTKRNISIGYNEQMHAIVVRATWVDDTKKEPMHTFFYAFGIEAMKFRPNPNEASVASLLEEAQEDWKRSQAKSKK